MNDPVTNVEIEDVLSSIRRLVSEGGRTAETRDQTRIDVSKPETDTPPESSDEDTSERLVLTPALRVEEQDQPDAMGAAGIEETADSSFARWDSEDQTSDEMPVETDLETAVESADFSTGHDHVWEDDSAVEDDDQGESETDPDPDEINVMPSDDPDSENVDEEDGIALADAQSLDSRIVQWEHLTVTQTDTYEPDEPGDSDYAGTDIQPLQWGEIETAEPTAEALTLTDAVDIEATENTEDLAEPISPETFEEEESDEPVSDGSVESVETSEDKDMNAQETSKSGIDALAEHVETVAQDYVIGAAEEAIAPEFEDFDGEDAFTIDEAMLREMVSDIVRQELQGALGERITRNVRKLVRREIHRALAAHDLE